MTDSVRTLTLPVTGMSCASCAARVEKALGEVEGVVQAEVNFADHAARVALSEGTDPGVLLTILDEMGYPADTTRITLDVEGMHCGSCVGRVENALNNMPGVVAAEANLAAKTAAVTFVPGAAEPQQLARQLTESGYAASVPAETTTMDPPRDRDAEDAEHLRRMTWIAAALTLPVFVMEMGGHIYPPLHHWIAQTIGTQASWLIQFALTTLVLIWPGRHFYRRGIPALLRGAPDMNALVAVGTGAAWIYSVVATFAPALLPESARHVYFEAAAVVVTLILLGRALEARAKGRTGAAVRHLLGLSAKTALVQSGDDWHERPVSDVLVGDAIKVLPGARIPVDGVVTEGTSYVDESMVSGEPLPVGKDAGAELIGGTVNGNGALVMRATAVGADTVLAQIIAMVREAQGARLPIQNLVNRITLWFVPAVLALAAVTVLAWLVFGPEPALTHALVAGVSVLIIACPCAMGLATPTSIMVGTGRAAELGVLFRKGDALQALQAVDVVAFDKTGTLTEGRPQVTALDCAPGFEPADVLAVAAAVEVQSDHPLAHAVLEEAKARGLDIVAATGAEAIPGYGALGVVGGRKVMVGAPRLLIREGVDTAQLDDVIARHGEAGRTVIAVAIDGFAAAVLAVADPIKNDARDTLRRLQGMGKEIALITGDSAATANAVAKELGITQVHAGVLPDQKAATVRALQIDGARKVAFVGDGINDAPALATADTGIALGTGTDVAIESADVVLMSGDVSGVATAIDISRRTMRNIRQNLLWAFGYNVLLIPVAMGVLYPLTGTLLSPALAAGAMALSSVLVVSNALRLRRVQPADGGAARPLATTTLAPAPAE